MPEATRSSDLPRPRTRLISARHQRGWSQQEVADRVGTTPLNVSRWERGLTTPGPAFRLKLSNLFRLSARELDLPVEKNEEEVPRLTMMESQSTEVCWDPAIPPPAPTPLVGRERELARLTQQLCSYTHGTLFALSGLPGVGKSTLAAAVAHGPKVQEYFADGILWAALGTSPDLSGVLSRWSALLGGSRDQASQPKTRQAWIQMLRATIGQRRLLLILDDAWQLDDALVCRVGGPNCSYLLTTRLPQVALAFAGKRVLAVGELEKEASLHLLQQLAPQALPWEKKQVQALLRAVGGLPLGLCLIGNYLRVQGYSGQPRRIQAAMERLQDAKQRLEMSEPRLLLLGAISEREAEVSLAAVIAVSVQQLDEQARDVLRSLAVFPAKPHSFTEEAALAVSEARAEVLDRLSDAGILESAGAGRYTLHPTIADYARQQELDTRVVERLTRYCADYAERYTQDFEALERESSVLLAGLETAYKQQQEADLLRAVSALADYWLARGEYIVAREQGLRALAAAHVPENRAGEGRMLLLLGETALRQGESEQAEVWYVQAIEIARLSGDGEQECAGLAGLGEVKKKMGKYEEATGYLQAGLQLARSGCFVRQEVRLLRTLGGVLYFQGDYEQALGHTLEGLQLARASGDHESICALLSDVAATSMERGDYTQAEQSLQEGLRLAQQLGYREWEYLALVNLGVAAGRQGHYKEAERHLQGALDVALRLGNPEHANWALTHLGAAAAEQGHYEEAERYVREGLSPVLQTGNPLETIAALTNLGEIVRLQDRYAEAEEILREALSMMRQFDNPERRSQVLANLGGAISHQGRYAEAEEILREALGMARRIGNPEWMSNALLFLGQVYTRQARYEEAESSLQEAGNLAQQIKLPALLCEILYELGTLFLLRHESAQAESILKEMLVSIPEGQQRLLALAHYGLARVAASQENLPAARRLAEESLALFILMEHRHQDIVRRWLAALDKEQGNEK